MSESSPIFEPFSGDSELRANATDRRRIIEILEHAREQGSITLEVFSDLSTVAKSAKTMGELFKVLSQIPEGAIPPLDEYSIASKSRSNSRQKSWLVLDIVTILAAIYLFVSVSHGSAIVHRLAIFIIILALALIVARNIYFRKC